MWTVVVAVATAALVRPHGCGPLTEAWAHYFPHTTHNIPITCQLDPSAKAPAVVSTQPVHLVYRVDAECAELLQELLVQTPTVTLASIQQAAAMFGTTSMACVNVTDCGSPTRFVCNTSVATPGYCVPRLLDSERTWKTPCFDGAHSTCTELIISAIGFGAGILLTIVGGLAV